MHTINVQLFVRACMLPACLPALLASAQAHPMMSCIALVVLNVLVSVWVAVCSHVPDSGRTLARHVEILFAVLLVMYILLHTVRKL